VYDGGRNVFGNYVIDVILQSWSHIVDIKSILQ